MIDHPLKRRLHRRWHVPVTQPVFKFAAIAISFALGSFGFARAYNEMGHPQPLSEILLHSLHLIEGGFPGDLEGRELPLMLQFARVALPLLTFWTTIALAWMQVRNPLRVRMMQRRGDHLVVSGDNDLTRMAVENLLDDGRNVLIWTERSRPDWVAGALQKGAAELHEKDGADVVPKLGLDKARAVLLLAQDDTGNTTRAGRIIDQAAAVRPAGDPLAVMARIDDHDLRRTVEVRFDRAGHSAARIRFASMPDLNARQLFLDWPLDRLRRANDPARGVFLFGLTPTVERYLMRLLAGGHFRDGVKPGFVVIDTDATQAEAGFRARNPGGDTLAPVVFVSAPVDASFDADALLGRLIAQHGVPVATVIDCGDDARSLGLALSVDNSFAGNSQSAPLIHVRLASMQDPRLGVSIHAFGSLSTFADPDMLIQEKHDALARSIHDFYLEGRLADGERIGSRGSVREWEDLSESFRDDNRLVADCYRLKLRDIGARLVDGSAAPLRLEPDEIEELARAEHDRWMAAKLATGWKHGEVRDDRLLVHPDIVPYDALSEPIKELDRDQIKVMTRLLSAAGKRALRVLPIAIDPANAQGADAALQAITTALTVHFPDRLPIFVGSVADPDSRQTLQSVSKAGHLVRIVAAGNLQEIIDNLPSAERASTLALLRSADSLLMVAKDGDAGAAIRAEGSMLISAEATERSAPNSTIRVSPTGSVMTAPWLG